MKTVLVFFAFSMISATGILAQQTITNHKHERILTHLEGNVFSVKFIDTEGNVAQEGEYWKQDNRFKPHGIWTLYAPNSDEIATKSEFVKGKQVWVETTVDGKIIKAGEQEIAINNIERQVQEPEKQLAGLKK
ncbi:MAG: hypothetical protein WD016_03925 [Balneolaceae bacterium]